jgi:hypothetical protein
MSRPEQQPAAPASRARADAVIVGGGIAGIWLLNLLHSEGYSVVLLESARLGEQQTLASQGMIHGGMKYALAGRLTRASETISAMPNRWADCLAGRGAVDLRGLKPLSERYYMFADASTLGQLTGFFASRALRGRIHKLKPKQYPRPFATPAFKGVVYELQDFVLDTRRLLETLLQPVRQCAYQWRVSAADISVRPDGVTLTLGKTELDAGHLILTAGAGNQALLDALRIDDPVAQLRPLNQVLVRHAHLEPLYAHCLTGIRGREPRLTITSHPDGDGWIWYLGGQLATDGATMSDSALIDHALAELKVCLPWLKWDDAEFSTLRVDRAEPAQTLGRRPDEAYASARGPCIVAWPTKLSLAPDMGDKVLALLPPPAQQPMVSLGIPSAEVGYPPWSH